MNNPEMDFHRQLKRLRTERGMTQEELAHACGWQGQSRIGNYESTGASARQPKLDELVQLARALGVSVAELLGEKVADSPIQESQGVRLDPAMLARTHELLNAAFALQGAVFDFAGNWDLFADAYEYLAEDDRPVDQRNLVDFGRWFAARKGQGEVSSDEGKPASGHADGARRRRAS